MKCPTKGSVGYQKLEPHYSDSLISTTGLAQFMERWSSKRMVVGSISDGTSTQVLKVTKDKSATSAMISAKLLDLHVAQMNT